MARIPWSRDPFPALQPTFSPIAQAPSPQFGNGRNAEHILRDMKLSSLLIVTVCLFPITASAQPFFGRFVSVGITGGAALTDAFSNETAMGVDTDAHVFSGSKDYIVGPTLELRLPLNLSVEFDALYGPLNLTLVNTVIPLGVFTTRSTVNSWEFPLLAKYRLPAHAARLFLEAGPSFRRVQSFAADSPHLSRAGFTAGGGVEFGIARLKIDPELRYTRWGSDSNLNPSVLNPASNANQAELLLGFSF